MRFSFGDFFAGITTNTWKIWLDLPDGVWDRLHRVIEERIPLPQGTTSRMVVVGTALAVHNILVQQRMPTDVFPQFLREIGDDGIVELAKRVIENGRGGSRPITVVPVSIHDTSRPVAPPTTPRSQRAANAIEHATRTLFPWMR